MATILVIDDEASILHAFRRAFSDPEDVLLTASSATGGLEVITRGKPDVVVLDSGTFFPCYGLGGVL